MSQDFSLGINDVIPSFTDRRGVLPIRDVFPSQFPYTDWYHHQIRYQHYWDWWRGQELEKVAPPINKSGASKKMYPLKINAIRTFARIMTAVLFGESKDTSTPLVYTAVKPRPNPRPAKQEDIELADNLQFILQEIWMQSNGRAIQFEAGKLSQFLGGAIFKLEWRPTDREARIPIFIKPVLPDHFIPIWQMDDLWNLLEAYWVYEVSRDEARIRYGIDQPKVMYTEHWTRTRLKITIGDTVIKDEVNPFGFVPFVYIPRLREGHFYGTSMVDDIEHLLKEFNSRMANLGDTVKNNAQRRRFGFNIFNRNMPKIVFDRGDAFIYDLGNQPHYSDAKPEIITEAPVNMPDSLIKWVEGLWEQMLFHASISSVALGVDKGSQRSALTLAFRMFPVTAMVDGQRTFWDEGLNLISKMIIQMILVKMGGKVQFDETIVIPPDVLKRMTFGQVWNPQIPRDREQLVNEAVLLSQAGLMSPETAIKQLGIARDIQEEISRIEEAKKRKMSMNGQPSNGAPTEIEYPVAQTGFNNQ